MHVSPSFRPSVCPCFLGNKIQVAFIIRLKCNFPKNICLAQGRTLLKLEIIGQNLDIAPIYIFVRFAFLLCTKRVISVRIVWNFARTIRLDLKISMPNLIEIGSDIAIATIYIVHPICYFCPPQP